MLTMKRTDGQTKGRQMQIKTKPDGGSRGAKHNPLTAPQAPTRAAVRSFIKVAGEGDLAAVQRMLIASPALAREWEPLMDAAFNGHAAVVKCLLDHGADANVLSTSSHRHRPLHRVVEHRKSTEKTAAHLDVVKALLEDGGADVSARATWLNVTPIALAAIGGERQFLPLLLPYLERWDLFTAAALGEARHVGTILQRDPARARDVDSHNGLTALHYAAASRLGASDPATSANLKRVAELLIDAGADVNAKATPGGCGELPPMHFAAGNKSVLQLLVLQGADPAAALRPALWDADYEVADTLIHAGAKVKSAAVGEWVADFSRWGHYPHSQWLIEHGADVNGRTADDGRTALHWAAHRGASAEFLRFLLDRGANLNLTDAEGMTALALAKSKKKARLVALLQKHGGRG